ncbi:MAG: beta-galactosidase trimerization domain-containing protein [Polyangiaceae bacterium]|nr:beta-galactosidase trimerization domain-containing protein [Polyangiaceae bacterium]
MFARRAALGLAAIGAAWVASPCHGPPPGAPAGPLTLVEGAAAFAAPAPSATTSASASASGKAVLATAPRASWRARVRSVGGQPAEPAREFVFDWQLAGAPPVTAKGGEFSPWAVMGAREAERFEDMNKGRADRNIPMRLLLGLRNVGAPTRVQLEVKLEGIPTVFLLEIELYGPKFIVLVVREGGQWRAVTTTEYNRRYWKAFAGLGLKEDERPKRFPVADRLTEAGDELTSYREGLAALRSLGINTFLLPPSSAVREELEQMGGGRLSMAVYSPPGYAFDYKGKTSPPELAAWADGLFKPYRDAGFTADDVALFALADEPGWYYPGALDDVAQSPAGLDRFRAFVRAKGLSPGELGVARWADLTPLGRSGVRDAATRKRHYWTTRFFSYDSSRHFAAATKAVEGALRPGVPIFANWNFFAGRLFTAGGVGKNPGAKHPDSAMAGHDWFDFARQRGGTMLWTEGWFGDDYAFYWPFYEGKLASAAAHGGLETGGYLIPRAIGKRAGEGFEQQMLALVGSGAKAISLFVFGPEYNFPGNCYSDAPNRPAHIAAATRLVAAAEDVLWPGRRPPASIAIVVPRSSYVWDPPGVEDATNTNPNFRHPDYSAEIADLFFAFAHANVPVDFIDEDDLNAAALAPYRAVYLSEPDVPEEGIKALGAWAQKGGTLVTVIGAGTGDRYGRPSHALATLTGVEQERPPARVILAQGGPAPGGRVHGAGPEGPVFGAKGRLRRHHGEALAWFDDGSPAIVRRTLGQGRHLHFDFFPGLSYFFSSHEKTDYLPVAFSEALRRWIVDPALAAGARPPVRADIELVETPLLLSNEGAALTLLNWTGEALAELTLNVTLPFTPRSVRSVRRGPLPFDAAPGGGIVVRLPVGGSDVLAIKP